MKLNSFKIRSSLWGTTALAIISILFCMTLGCGRDKMDTDNLGSPLPIVSEVSTTWITSTTTSTVTTSSTSTSTTSTTTTTTTEETTSRIETTTVTTNQTIVIVTETEAVYMPEPVTEPTCTEPICEQTNNDLPISDYEKILLRNVVASEYGSDYHGYGGAPVTPYERACIVAVVMNRLRSPNFPNTIEGVLTQPNQFNGYYACNYEWNTVTDNVRAGVNYYFEHPDEFGNWLSFEGDGKYNYFS